MVYVKTGEVLVLYLCWCVLNAKPFYHHSISTHLYVFAFLMFVFRKAQDPKPVVVHVKDQALPSTAQVSVDRCRQ